MEINRGRINSAIFLTPDSLTLALDFFFFSFLVVQERRLNSNDWNHG